MQLTIDKIKRIARKITDYSRPGCFIVTPSLALVCLENIHTDKGSFEKGETVHAIEFDETGEHPNTFRPIEKGFWWDISLFKIAKHQPQP